MPASICKEPPCVAFLLSMEMPQSFNAHPRVEQLLAVGLSTMLREDFERLAFEPQGLRQILQLHTSPLGMLLLGGTVGRLTFCGVTQLSCSPFCIQRRYRGYFFLKIHVNRIPLEDCSGFIPQLGVKQ